MARKPKTSKAVPKTPKKPGRPPGTDEKTRIKKVWLKLLKWSEAAADDLQPETVDTILHVLAFHQTEQTSKGTSTKDEPDAPDKAPEIPWDDNEEREYLKDLADCPGMVSDYLDSPDNSDEMKDYLRQCVKDLEDNPVPDPPELESLRLP
jgi:hypothetical protein